MFLSNEEIKELKKYIDGIYWDTDRMSRDGKYFLNKLDSFVENLEKKKKEVYVVTNNAVVDDEIIYNIAGVTTSLEEAQYLLSETVKDIKCDANFDTLNAIKLTDDINPSKLDEIWIYEENDLGFELYLNGNYNSNSYSAQIEKFDIMKELDKDNSMEI